MKCPGKNSIYKCFWKGEDCGFGGVAILIAEKWIDKVISITRIDSRLISIRILNGKNINIFSIYAPQTGRSQEEKDKFYDKLLGNLTAVPDNEFLLVCGDFNGHVGQDSNGFDGVHGNLGYGSRNAEGIRLLDLCVALDLAITNTFFTKSQNKLIPYKSGHASTQVDYILVRRPVLKLVCDTKVIGGEECITQHKLLISDINIKTIRHKPRIAYPKLRIWKLKSADTRSDFECAVSETALPTDAHGGVEGIWTSISKGLLNACE